MDGIHMGEVLRVWHVYVNSFYTKNYSLFNEVIRAWHYWSVVFPIFKNSWNISPKKMIRTKNTACSGHTFHSLFENRDRVFPCFSAAGFRSKSKPQPPEPQQVIGLSDFSSPPTAWSQQPNLLCHTPSPPLPAFWSFKVLGDWWRCQPCSWACHLASSPRHSRTKHVAKVSLATLTRGSWIVWALSNKF